MNNLMSSTFKEFKDIQYPLVEVPFHGASTLVVLKELNQAELRSCGEFSLIETKEDRIKIKEKPTVLDMVKYTQTMARIAEVSLVKPTYVQLMAIYDGDNRLKDFETTLRQMKEEAFAMEDKKAQMELEERIARVEVWCYMILPEDFLGAITSYATGVDKSNIKTLTKETLINIAILAERGHDNPADHIDGLFTSFMKDDINSRAWQEHNKWREENSKKEQKSREKKLTNRRIAGDK